MFHRSSGNRKERRQSTNVRDLLVRGRAAAKVGDTGEARHYLEWVLRTEANEDQRVEAWYWLSEISSDPAEKRRYLEQILARSPAHALARRSMALLDGRLQADEVINPDTLPATSGGETREVATDRFTCPRCAARMVFMPDGTALHCEHCGYSQVPQANATQEELAEQDFIVALATARGHTRPATMQTFECEGCAAVLLLAPETISTTCPYCDATYAVRVTQQQSVIAPQGIVPITITADTAQRTANKWLQKHGLRTRAPVHGFYVPCWTFDIGGHISWRGWQYEREKRGYADYTVEVPISGEWPVHFDDLLVPATSKMPAALLQAATGREAEPGAVREFDSHYLADWPAALHDLPLAAASLQARKLAVEQIREKGIRAAPGVRDFRWNTAGVAVISYKLLLLPLWIAHYRVEGQQKTILVNGQNGRLYGERPPSSGLFDDFRRLFGR